MTNSLEKIYFVMGQKVLVEAPKKPLDPQKLATLIKNLSVYGYGITPNLIANLGDDNITNFYHIADHMLKTTLGADKDWSPMYPNFPEQVMEAGASELYLNAICHYWGDAFGQRVLPQYMKDERPPMADDFEGLKFIDVGSMEDFAQMMKTRFGSSTEYTPQFKEDVEFMAREQWSVLSACLPDEFDNKENMAFVVKLFSSHKRNISKFGKNATDVLRIAVALSDGDISLASPSKFKKFKRSERKMFLSMLERMPNLEEDMLRHRMKWIRLGEIIHPGEYKNRFTKAFSAFDILRNIPSVIETFNSTIERLIESGDVKRACDHLASRPTEFARRLNKLLSMKTDPEYVIKSFGEVAEQVSEKVLLEVMAYFSNRGVRSDLRVFFPKGNVGKAKAIEDKRESISASFSSRITSVVTDALLKKLSVKDPLGKVYIDPRMENYVVPFANRSASKALITHTRGTRLPIMDGMVSNGTTIRFFLWWKDIKGDKYNNRVDVDLTGAFFKEDWSHHSQISYTNLRDASIKSCHSGDITSAPNGACEFIDVDMESARAKGVRYVAMCVYSYTNQPFSDIPECFVGWMERRKVQSGEIFEPKTVKNKVDLDTEARTVVPMVIDLEKKEIIWMDMAIQSSYAMNNIRTTENAVSKMGKALTEMKKPDMYTLLSLNAQARGTIVDNPDDADVEFHVHKGVRPEDYEVL